MKKVFFLKLFVFFSAPLLVVVLYFVNDPFKVLYHYNSYYTSGIPQKVMINTDMAATQNWENHYNLAQYDSYIFGSSRAMQYHVDSWCKYINSTKCYHFDAVQESLFGIEKKLEFLKKKHAVVKNAIFILDYEILECDTDRTAHISMKDPDLTGGSRLNFQMKFFNAYLDKAFLWNYLSLLLRGRVLDEKNNTLLLVNDARHYDSITNENVVTAIDAQIARNPDSFYQLKKDIFYTRPVGPNVGPVVIGEKHMDLLRKMKEILSSGNTNYKIVISPLYDQIQLNPHDLNALQQIFGQSVVFDFSGKNSITENKYNYYESSHYRPFVADSILATIYRQ